MKAWSFVILVGICACADAPDPLAQSIAGDTKAEGGDDAGGDDDDDDDDSAGGDDDDDDDDATAGKKGGRAASPRSANASGFTTSSGGAPSTGVSDQRSCMVSFKSQLLPAFNDAGCTGAFCHGRFFGHELRIDETDGEVTYSELTGFKLGGKAYVVPGALAPSESAIHCHLAGTCGAEMPPSGDPPTKLAALVDAWLGCGAPKN